MGVCVHSQTQVFTGSKYAKDRFYLINLSYPNNLRIKSIYRLLR